MLVDKINPESYDRPGADWRGDCKYSVRLFLPTAWRHSTLYSLNAILQGTSFPPWMAKIMASWFRKTNGDAGGLMLKRRTILAAARAADQFCYRL
ncbi:hypothetical protein KCP77_10610 [Salmonella enterica subsp. enterica]|nr:hypothetical protein KCP77_10610 [Salmonella enterica subsp. enterica]